MTRPRVVLDCDPGIDDAVAIAVALAYADVVGISTVGGNVGVAQATTNALAICDLLGSPTTPVHAGADLPLDGELRHRATAFHGPRGTGSSRLAPPSRPATSNDAVGWLVETAQAEEGLWLVATGPLTNVATAILRAPDLVDRMAGIVWMGGSTRNGDATAAAEFNSWVDPVAARIVFEAGHRDLTMVGLNVTERVLVDRPWIDRLAAATVGTPTEVFAEMLADYEARQRSMTTFAGAAVHDAVAVVRVTHPWLLAGLRRPVEVVVEPGPARGATIADERAHLEPPPANATVVEWAEADGIRAVVFDALTSRYPVGQPLD